ncbi:MAG: hypothetical protein PHR11_00600 [Candidatus Omnitrophica bacterium]|nr:hypothetical protein [Candidatus Omnitrophota bacterium]
MQISLPFTMRYPVLAFGSQGKNTLCFAAAKTARISAMHPELSVPADFSAFKRCAMRLLKDTPRTLAFDLHPGYQSSVFAVSLRRKAKLSAVQHHHAHIASCMAENGLANRRVIGVAFDGTGLGSDGSLWGAEFLVCDYAGFRRAAHLKAIPLLGMEMGVRQPYRTAAAWLYATYKEGFLKRDFRAVRKIRRDWPVFKKMYLSGFAAPAASSMGRFFDAASCLVFDKTSVSREAELACLLESAAASCRQAPRAYPCAIERAGGMFEIDPRPLFRRLAQDVARKKPKPAIAYAVHAGISEALVEVCRILRRQADCKRVVLSGGVFQNAVLRGLAVQGLRAQGFDVFTHRLVSCGDSGISLGQAAVANFMH